MNFGDIYGSAIAQVVSLSQVERLPDANEAFVKAMVNVAYHRVERAQLWKFCEEEAPITSAVNTRTAVGVPSNMNVPLMVHDDDSDTPLSYHDERQKFLSLDETGTPSQYAMWKGELRFYPLPKTVRNYTLRYYKTWVDLIADLDEPEFPATWHDLLINYAAGKLAQRLPATGDRFLPHSLAQPFLDDFEAGLLRMTQSPLVMPTWDAVPNYGFQDEVLTIAEW